MNKLELKILTGSVTITCMLSAIFGLAGSSIVGTFWGWFWISFLCQIIIFAVTNSFIINKTLAAQQKAEILALDQLSKFSINISCAYCNQRTITPIQLNQKNTFKCESCNQVNGISMQFTSTTLTTPLESVKIPLVEQSPFEFKVSA